MFSRKWLLFLVPAILVAAAVITGILIYQNSQQRPHDVNGTSITAAESGAAVPSDTSAETSAGQPASTSMNSSDPKDSQGSSLQDASTSHPEPTPNSTASGGNVASTVSGETTSKPGETTSKPGETTSNPGETTANSGEVKYKYDSLGRVKCATFPDGSSLLYTYDANGNLLSVKRGAEVSSEDRG